MERSPQAFDVLTMKDINREHAESGSLHKDEVTHQPGGVMTAYSGHYAELYDIFYADKAYEEEAIFVHKCLQKYGPKPTRRLLELACGTGSHALVLATLGYEIMATDYSEDMLRCAKRKAAGAACPLHFQQQDMRKLDLQGAPFDAVICLFDSIGYVQTNEALMQTLRGVHHHLRPDGLFLFECWHAAAMLRNYEPVRVRRWSTPTADVLRISETKLDPVKQLAHVTYTIYELFRDGSYTSLKETHTNRFFLVQEVAGWLSYCGLTPLRWFAGFTPEENVTENTWHIVAIARK